MQFTLLTTLLLATFAIATPAPKKQEGFQVVIKYVDAPDCDATCGTNTTTSSKIYEPTTTITSTNTKYVVVTLETAYGTTTTLGCETYSTTPTGYTTSTTPAGYDAYGTTTSSTSSYAPVPTY